MGWDWDRTVIAGCVGDRALENGVAMGPVDTCEGTNECTDKCEGTIECMDE